MKEAGLVAAIILAGILVLSSIVFSLPNAITIGNSGVISAISPLHTEGRYIKNVQNQTIILRGVNCGGFADAPGGIWSNVGFQTYAYWQSHQNLVTAELDAIKSWGCNVVRVMFAAEYWVYNTQNHRQIIKELAGLLAQRNMYMIYEGWCIRGYGNGAAQDQLPYPPFQSSANASAVIPNEQAYVDMMLNITITLGSYNNVIVGTWNEAGWDNTNATVQSGWFNVIQQVISGTRSAGVNNIILVQWGYALWANFQFPPPSPPAPPRQAGVLDWIYYYPLNGTSVAYQTHLYDSYGQNATYSQIVQGLTYDWLPYVTFNLSKPVLIGETGANLWNTGQALASELSQFNSTLYVLNGWDIGYIGWEWRSTGSYPLITSDNPLFTPSSAGTLLKNAIRDGAI